MATIKVHGGDFNKGDSSFFYGNLRLNTPAHPIMGESIPKSQLQVVEMASEENVKKIGGAVGWGIAAGLLFGPVGLLAGLLAGGRRKQVTFVAVFKDGRKLLATTDNKTYTELMAAVF